MMCLGKSFIYHLIDKAHGVIEETLYWDRYKVEAITSLTDA